MVVGYLSYGEFAGLACFPTPSIYPVNYERSVMKFKKGDTVIYGLDTGKVIKTSPVLVVRFKRKWVTFEDVTFPTNSEAYSELRKA